MSVNPVIIENEFPSLVKYDNPVLISRDNQSHKKKKGKDDIEDILNKIIPPVKVKGSNKLQYVSSTPATPNDVLTLQEQLDQQLLQRQARETGICQIREDLYAQCFDELIRQITIACNQRGELLFRVKQQIMATLASYRLLYESSISFGMRKTLTAEKNKSKKKEAVLQLENECKQVEQQVIEWQNKISSFQTMKEKERESETQLHQNEVIELTNRINKLRQELQNYFTI